MNSEKYFAPLPSPSMIEFTPTASAAPKNSASAYGMHHSTPAQAEVTSLPIATAGLKHPPDTTPAPYAPARTVKAIAIGKYSLLVGVLARDGGAKHDEDEEEG